jgi:hypothetical protein
MENTHMVNKDLFEVYIPAADRVMGAYRNFTEALNLTKTMFCEVHIRKNLELECIVHARNNPALDIKKE